MSKHHRRPHARRAQGNPSSLFEGGESPHEHLSHRSQRLEQLLLDEIQSILRDHATDPALEGVGIVRVVLAPDAGHARVAYVVVDSLHQARVSPAHAQAALERATGFIRARLAIQLSLKKLPRLTFTLVAVVPGGER